MKLIRPLPKDEIKKSLEKSTRIIIIDQALSGNGGIMYSEIKSIFLGQTTNAISLGKHLRESDIISALDSKEEVIWI